MPTVWAIQLPLDRPVFFRCAYVLNCLIRKAVPMRSGIPIADARWFAVRERFKKKITVEQALDDYAVLYQKHNKRNYFAAGTVSVLVIAGNAAMLKLLGFWAFLIFFLLSALIMIRPLFKLKWAVAPEELLPENYNFVKDTVINKILEDDGDSTACYLVFEKSGTMSVPPRTDSHLFIPNYKDAEKGEAFYLIRFDPNVNPCWYPCALWRADDLTEADIAEEIREEEELIARLIACERFPKLTMGTSHFADSDRTHYLVSRDRPQEARNLLERFAAMHFCGNILSAMEFILRYCPEDLQKEAFADFTPRQQGLRNAVMECLKDDERKKKREETVKKIRSSVFGSDTIL